MRRDILLGCSDPGQACLLLIKISLGFFILHCSSVALIHFAGFKENFYQDFFASINMDKEFNLPAFYSGLLLAVIAFLLKELGVSSIAKQRLSWILLSKIFLFLAIDEIFQIHELLQLENFAESKCVRT